MAEENNPVPGPNETVEVSAMAFGGKGLARVAGKVYFVPDAVPGDLVKIEVVNDSGRYAEARITDFVRKSPLRGPSICPYSDRCGGCLWQGIPYEQQLAWKRSFVETALGRIGRVEAELDVPISGSCQVQSYRNRIFLRGVFQKDGRVVFGYFRRGSRELVQISRCAIADETINEFLVKVKSSCFSRSQKVPLDTPFRMEIQRVYRHQGQTAGVVVTVYPPDPSCRELDDLVIGLRSVPDIVWVGLVAAAVRKGSADPGLSEPPLVEFERDLIHLQDGLSTDWRNEDGFQGQITYLTRPGQFQQVNVNHNRMVRSLVRELVEGYAPERVLDLFCGSGNLSLDLCREGRYVEGVEFSATAIATARENVRINQLTGVVYIAGDTEKHLWKCAKKGEKFDVVIADPPREGMYKALIPIQKIAPRAIIYVSCDPATLARDVGALIRGGYRLRFLRAFDFFPNTWHVESIAVLER